MITSLATPMFIIALTAVVFALAVYCFLTAIFPRLPMPLRWGAALAPSQTHSLSRVSRVALGMAAMLFACLPLVGEYRPAMFHRAVLAVLIALALLLIVGYRDWRGKRHVK
jgi:hypothetical protein